MAPGEIRQYEYGSVLLAAAGCTGSQPFRPLGILAKGGLVQLVGALLAVAIAGMSFSAVPNLQKPQPPQVATLILPPPSDAPPRPEKDPIPSLAKSLQEPPEDTARLPKTAEEDPSAKRMEFVPDTEGQIIPVTRRFGASIAIIAKEDYDAFLHVKNMPLRAICEFEAPEWDMVTPPPGKKLIVNDRYPLLVNYAEKNRLFRDLLRRASTSASKSLVFLLFPYKQDGFDGSLFNAIRDFALRKKHVGDVAQLPDWRSVKLKWSDRDRAGVIVLDLEFATTPQKD